MLNPTETWLNPTETLLNPTQSTCFLTRGSDAQPLESTYLHQKALRSQRCAKMGMDGVPKKEWTVHRGWTVQVDVSRHIFPSKGPKVPTVCLNGDGRCAKKGMDGAYEVNGASARIAAHSSIKRP